MYLHIGNNFVVKKSEIVAVFDLETTSVGKKTREFLKKAEKEGKIITVSLDEIPKTYILCKDKIYISPFSSQTLSKR